MDTGPEPDRDALLALIDRMLRAEARAEPPPEGERGDWLFGHLDYAEPDTHGWTAPLPPRVWMPRALCFWHEVMRMGGTISAEQADHPSHSLARWPAIEQAVQAYRAYIVMPA